MQDNLAGYWRSKNLHLEGSSYADRLNIFLACFSQERVLRRVPL